MCVFAGQDDYGALTSFGWWRKAMGSDTAHWRVSVWPRPFCYTGNIPTILHIYCILLNMVWLYACLPLCTFSNIVECEWVCLEGLVNIFLYFFIKYFYNIHSFICVCLYVFQRLKVDLDRSTAVSQPLGARVARCTLNGLADFLHRWDGDMDAFI